MFQIAAFLPLYEAVVDPYAEFFCCRIDIILMGHFVDKRPGVKTSRIPGKIKSTGNGTVADDKGIFLRCDHRDGKNKKQDQH
jgi:hypothetical protein